MKLVEINWNPSARQLRQFGLICSLALPFLGWLWSGSPRMLMWLGGLGCVLALGGLLVPLLLRPVFIGLMLVALPIGLVVSELAMALIYFGVFLPIGVCFRVMKRDSLSRSLDRNSPSYWQDKKSPTNVSSYYRQW